MDDLTEGNPVADIIRGPDGIIDCLFLVEGDYRLKQDRCAGHHNNTAEAQLGGVPESLEDVEAMFHVLPQAARVWNDSSTGAEVITPTPQKPGKSY
ncbi:hypothetical protein N7452_003651 [Penicillium brevicompactum]|uniref:Uncharacterized protein n=1 Tax=Penicillium brevicompactum TaxID=5074 RepID=A0A9W9QU44_PENBR|nr:hypothetical protein N7452_003651 [Penicillium brevicompactum]